MKRLIIFLLLFAAIKVAGQTTGYLRFDTVKIMKQNGTCELYIINKTKDSLGLLTNVGGGLTQFRKSRMLNDSTLVVGLDTLTIRGTGGSSLSIVNDLGPLAEMRVFVPAKGIAGTDTVTGYSFTAVDSALAYFSSSIIGVSGNERGGYLANGTSGDSLRTTVPFGVLIGDSQAEGHTTPSSQHSRTHAGGLNVFDNSVTDVAGQISFHLRPLTHMRWFNHGIGGQTTAQVRERFYRDALGAVSPGTALFTTRTLYEKPQIVIIIAGINDVFNGMTVEQTKENLEWMAQVLQENQVRCVMLNLPGDAISGQTELRKIAEINKWMASGVLQQYGVCVVDYNSWWNDPAYGNDNVHNTALIADDIHPSAVGYDSLANYIFREAKLPVLTQATFYMEISPDGFTGYSRPTDITIAAIPYTLSGSTSTIDITDYVPDSAWIKIIASTNVTGTTHTGFNHIVWHLDNNADDIDYYTQRGPYIGSTRATNLFNKVKIFQPVSITSGDRVNLIDARFYDSSYKALQLATSGATAILKVNQGTGSGDLLSGAVIEATGHIAATGIFSSTSTSQHRFGQLQLTSSNGKATTTGFGIGGNNTSSGIDFQTTGLAGRSSFEFTNWDNTANISLGGTINSVTSHISTFLGWGNAGNSGQTGNIIRLRPTYNQTSGAFTGIKFVGIYYSPILTSITNVRHYGLLFQTGNNYLNATSDSTCIGCDSSAFINAKFRVNGPVRFDLGSDATGDVYYRNSAGLVTRLGIGTDGDVLTLASGLPSWAAPSGGSISGLTAGRVTLSTGATTIGDDASLLYDAANSGTLSIGTSTTVGHFNIGGNRNFDGTASATGWGVGLRFAPTTFTDNVTSASGSTNFIQNYLESPTLAATNATITATAPITLRADAPTPGSNVTITIPYSIAGFGGAVWFNGATKTPINAGVHNSTVSYANDFVTCDATGGNFNINVPSASTYSGFEFVFKRLDNSGNTCTVTAADNIDGSGTYSLSAQYKYVRVKSNGSTWLVIANN